MSLDLDGTPHPEKNAPAFVPSMALTLDAKVSPNTRIHVTSSSLQELARVMAVFNLVPPPPGGAKP